MNRLSTKRYMPFIMLAFMAFCITTAPKTVHAEELSAENVAGAETIDVKKAKELFDAGVIFIDSRSKAAFDSGRIPSAENIPLSKEPTAADYDAVKATLGKLVTQDKPVVMYCNGLKCPLSATMATKAVEWGYKKIYYFRGGYPAWKEAGYVTE